MTTRETRDLARTAGVFVDESDTITCEADDDELVASDRLAKIGCVTPRGPSSSSDLRIGAGGVVDVSRWADAAAALLCEEVATGPAVLGAPEATFGVEIEVVVRDNDLTQGYVRGRSVRGGGDVDAPLRRIDDALRRLGAPGRTASASDVRAAASCRGSSRRPISVP